MQSFEPYRSTYSTRLSSSHKNLTAFATAAKRNSAAFMIRVTIKINNRTRLVEPSGILERLCVERRWVVDNVVHYMRREHGEAEVSAVLDTTPAILRLVRVTEIVL